MAMVERFLAGQNSFTAISALGCDSEHITKKVWRDRAVCLRRGTVLPSITVAHGRLRVCVPIDLLAQSFGFAEFCGFIPPEPILACRSGFPRPARGIQTHPLLPSFFPKPSAKNRSDGAAANRAGMSFLPCSHPIFSAPCGALTARTIEAVLYASPPTWSPVLFPEESSSCATFGTRAARTAIPKRHHHPTIRLNVSAATIGYRLAISARTSASKSRRLATGSELT